MTNRKSYLRDQRMKLCTSRQSKKRKRNVIECGKCKKVREDAKKDTEQDDDREEDTEEDAEGDTEEIQKKMQKRIQKMIQKRMTTKKWRKR